MLQIDDLKKREKLKQIFLTRDFTVAIFANFNSNTSSLNQASVVYIPLENAEEAEEALLRILIAESKYSGLWDQEWNEQHPNLDEFVNAIFTWGRFSNTEAKLTTTDEFWANFSSTIDAISKSQEFEFQLNGQNANYLPLLNKSEISQVYCFDNKWNEHNYLIKTSKYWILYNWII